MKHFQVVLATILCFFVCPNKATAATYVAVYRGHVSYGYDKSGEFGSANSDLSGAAFTSIYTFTTPLPIGVEVYNNGITNSFSGYYDAAVISASIMINGHIQNFEPGYYGQAGLSNESVPGNGSDVSFHEVRDFLLTENSLNYKFIFNVISSNSNDFLISSDFGQNLRYNARRNDQRDGYFEISKNNFLSGSEQSAYAVLRNDSITLGNVAGIPEPSTWFLFILGFSLVGAVARQNRAMENLGYGGRCRLR
jgi:hypothetical protein